MTNFELMVPLVALAVAVVGALWIRSESKKIDRLLGRDHDRHPAE